MVILRRQLNYILAEGTVASNCHKLKWSKFIQEQID